MKQDDAIYTGASEDQNDAGAAESSGLSQSLSNLLRSLRSYTRNRRPDNTAATTTNGTDREGRCGVQPISFYACSHSAPPTPFPPSYISDTNRANLTSTTTGTSTANNTSTTPQKNSHNTNTTNTTTTTTTSSTLPLLCLPCTLTHTQTLSHDTYALYNSLITTETHRFQQLYQSKVQEAKILGQRDGLSVSAQIGAKLDLERRVRKLKAKRESEVERVWRCKVAVVWDGAVRFMGEEGIAESKGIAGFDEDGGKQEEVLKVSLEWEKDRGLDGFGDVGGQGLIVVPRLVWSLKDTGVVKEERVFSFHDGADLAG